MNCKNDKFFVSKISMFTMFIRIILLCCLLLSTECAKSQKDYRCLTGYMTEVQSWVDDMGALTAPDGYESAIDLSANPSPVPDLQQKMMMMKSGRGVYVKYLSMARCRLTTVPTVFLFRDSTGVLLSDMIEYITFYGNEFLDISSPAEYYGVSMNATGSRERDIKQTYKHKRSSTVKWYTGFKETVFPHLKELDLRACRIQILSDNIFKGMPKLEALYIGENEVVYIDANAFAGLENLIHLDFSQNVAYDEKGHQQILTTETLYVFESLKNLSSLDLSFTKLAQRHVSLLKCLGPKMTRLSLCETGLSNLEENIFSKTSLSILDLSRNSGILSKSRTLSGLEDTLEILYAKDTGLRTMDIFEKFVHLEILDLSINEIAMVNPRVTETLKNLQILNLDMNRVTSWFTSTFSLLPSLKLLSLRDNNINLISEEIITDLANVQYLGMSRNFIVCNCHTREFFDLALHNEKNKKHKTISGISAHLKFTPESLKVLYHTGFSDFNEQIIHRNEVSKNCTEELCYDKINEELQANFLILDYDPGSYMCLIMAESTPTEFSKVEGCNKRIRDIDYDTVIEDNKQILFILLTIPVFFVILVFAYIFRRNFRYCYITLRNSAMLSLVHKNEFVDESTIFHYDVFVSYCNEDRYWVLDHLLPHLESDCSISACLHERDFQVGHSILENIVSCMDRSRSIMLIISKRFLLSQWCQFEMHLAQHRLLETRREDLTLVFLEEIPRRLRPNTLHYLMLTKTYIVWPNEGTERALFWKRLKKTLVTMKQRHFTIEGVSLA